MMKEELEADGLIHAMTLVSRCVGQSVWSLGTRRL